MQLIYKLESEMLICLIKNDLESLEILSKIYQRIKSVNQKFKENK